MFSYNATATAIAVTTAVAISTTATAAVATTAATGTTTETAIAATALTLPSTSFRKMPPNGCLTLSTQQQQQIQQVIPSRQSPLDTLAVASPTTPTTIPGTGTAIAANILKYNCQDHEQLVDNTNDTFNNYTDTFDLSLLPQEINHQATNNTTIFLSNHLYNTNELSSNLQQQQQQSQQQQQQQNTYKYIFGSITPITPPEIKIEQPTWQTIQTTNNGDIKQETTFHCYDSDEEKNKQNQLQVPFLSNIVYPSPQSSPAQAQEYTLHHQHQINHNQHNKTTQDTLTLDNNSLFNLTLKTSHNTSINTVSAATNNIKEEQFHILPPSPPESSYSETPSPLPPITINSNSTTIATISTNANTFSFKDVKSEPFETNFEKLNDLKLLPIGETHHQKHQQQRCSQNDCRTSDTNRNQIQGQQEYQVLREFLEDTTFQKKHNLKPLALDSIIGGIEEVPADIEPVIYLALQHVKREAEATCLRLQISHDPSLWSPKQVQLWLEATLQQFKLPSISNLRNIFPEAGHDLLQLSEEEFVKRAPECGSTLHAQLELWKLAYSDDYNKQHEQHLQQQQQQNIYIPTLRTNVNNIMTTAKTAATRTITTTTGNNNGNSSSNNNIQLELMVTEQNQQELEQQQQSQQQQQQQQQQDIWNTAKLIATNQHMDVQDESDDEGNNFPNNLLYKATSKATTITERATNTATSIILNSIKSLVSTTTIAETATTTTVTTTFTTTTINAIASNVSAPSLSLLSSSSSTTLAATTTTAAATTTAISTITPTIRSTCSSSNGIMKRTTTRSGGSHIHLWQFLKELLATPQTNSTVIRWLDRQKGIFKIEDSVRVAKLWGKRKNRPAMNYDKLSRSIRQYYKKGIMKKTERSQRLVYQFCQPYHT